MQTKFEDLEISKAVETVIGEKTIYAFPPLKGYCLKKLKSELSKYKEINYIVMGKKNRKTIVIRYYKKSIKSEDIENYIAKALKDYDEGRYRECIDTLKFVALQTKYINKIVYDKLSKAYKKTGNTELSDLYAKIVLELIDQEKTLENDNVLEEDKPHVDFPEEDFYKEPKAPTVVRKRVAKQAL